MKSVFLTAVLLSVACVASAANPTTYAKDPEFDENQVPEIREVKTERLSLRTFSSTAIGSATCSEPSNANLLMADASGEMGAFINDLNVFNVVLDQVVNTGKKVWDLVKKGEAVVNLKADVATALPSGAKCWMDMQTWSAPIAKTYTVSYKNIYGITVAQLGYRVIVLPGGSVNGKGAYIGYAAIDPNVDTFALWGYNLTAESAVQTVYNMGTKENPVAGMNLNITWKVESLLGANARGSQTFYMNGKGQLQPLK